MTTTTPTTTTADRLAERRSRRAARAASDKATLALLVQARRGARGPGSFCPSDVDEHAASAVLDALVSGASLSHVAQMARAKRTNNTRDAVRRTAILTSATLGAGWHGATVADVLAAEHNADTVTAHGVTVRARCTCGRTVRPATDGARGWVHHDSTAHTVEVVRGSARVVAIDSTPCDVATDAATPRDAAIAADGEVERADRDTARKWDRDRPTFGPADTPDVYDPRAMPRFKEATTGARTVDGKGQVRLLREGTVEGMLRAMVEMGPAGMDHSRPDETDRIGGRNWWHAFLSAPVPVAKGAHRARLVAAIDAANDVAAMRAELDGRPEPAPMTLGAIVVAAYRVTSARRQSSREVLRSTDTTEHSEIAWGEILTALHLVGLRSTPATRGAVRRDLKRAVETIARDAQRCDVRFNGATVATSLPFPGRTVA